MFQRHRLLATGLACLLASFSIIAERALAESPHPTLSKTQPNLEHKYIRNARQLILAGKRSGEGYFGPQGRYMIFQSERQSDNPFFQMHLLDFDAGEIQRISNGVGKTTCGWIHPNQKHVMYASTHDDPKAQSKQAAELAFRASGKERRYSWDYDPHYEIYRDDLWGGNPVNLTQSYGYDAEGSYSPDGKQIVFASNRQAYTGTLSPSERERLQVDPAYFMDLYIMDSDGGNVKQLTQAKGYDGGPFFSPDGQEITFRRFNEAGDKAEIWTMKRDGSEARAITNLGVMSWAPFYHPSGEYLVFATNLHGFANFELYAVDRQGRRQPLRISSAEGFDGLPAFSPDGQKLVWTSNRSADKRSQLFIADWDHAAVRQALNAQPLQKPQLKAAQSVPHEAFQIAHTAPQTQPAIRAADIEKHVRFLASEELEGRMTGSAGEQKAIAYAARAFKQMGLKPAGDANSYFQAFEFTAGVKLAEGNLLQERSRSFSLQEDWLPLIFSESGEFEGELVFAGYGLKAPENGEFKGYDSYFHLDVKDKWVVVLRYWPENVDEVSKQELKRYAGLRYKAMLAREQGAKGLIVISGPNSPDKHEVIPFHSQSAPGTVSIPALSVSKRIAQLWFQDQGKSLQEIQEQLDTGKAIQGFDLETKLLARVKLNKIKKTGRNVLAKLEVPGATQTLVIGAHLDHLGKGHNSSSLAQGNEQDLIHYGADDNASGSAGVLELAEALSQQPEKLKQNILFALWSGEEVGLLGSKHFGEQYTDEAFKQRFSAYLNMDMIGRLDRALVLQGVGSSKTWKGLLEKSNLLLGLPLVLQETAYLPTDATSFYLKGIPVLSAFTGAHRDYHTPGDTADKLNYPGTEKSVKLLYQVARKVAQNPQGPPYQRIEPPKQQQNRALRVYLGTIPDYASGEVKGLRLSGVSAGGPAEKAGLKAGDIIVELNGKSIENIYDYTYAIDTLKVGQLAQLVVVRAGQRIRLDIVPGARN